jgi:hypothetical protein
VNANVGGDDSAINDDGGVCRGGYKDENNDNEDSALCDESASFGYKPPQNGQMPASPHEFYAVFGATLSEETASETDRYVRRKRLYNMNGSQQNSQLFLTWSSVRK